MFKNEKRRTQTISSKDNSRVKKVARLLKSSSYRRKNNAYVVEGWRLLLSFSASSIRFVLVKENTLLSPKIDKFLQKIPFSRIFILKEEIFTSLSQLQSGSILMAVVDQNLSLEVNEVKGDCLVLDQVQDPGNVGTLLRTAVAAGLTQVVGASDTVDVFNPKVVRAAMGAHQALAFAFPKSLESFFACYPGRIYVTRVCTEAHSLYEENLISSVNAWVLGNEGNGVKLNIQNLNPQRYREIYIPMEAEGIESLNVASAGAICLFEQRRQKILQEI